MARGAGLASRDARDQLRDCRAGQQDEQPDADELDSGQNAIGHQQQSKHHQTQADVIRLGKRVQARQRVGKAQQAIRAGQEESAPAAIAETVKKSSIRIIGGP